MQDSKTGRFASRDFTGHRSGRLTMIRSTGNRDRYGYTIWIAQCDCGSTIARSAQVFTRRNPLSSCGCGKKGRPASQTHQEALFKKHCINAAQRGHPFSLTEEDHQRITSSDCAYCGAEPKPRPHPYLRVLFSYNGIDRIDNTRGYEPDNCAPCCPVCNVAKSDMALDDFKAWVARVFSQLHVAPTIVR